MQIIRLKGKAIHPYINELAQLRIEIFKEYPYLYQGDLSYEKKYLQTYLDCPESVMILALDAQHVVGASTAIPLKFETREFQRPFLALSYNLNEIFYFGESVLHPDYRGQKLYRHFFAEREAAAKEYGCSITTFCAVERPDTDPRRPANYVSLDAVWQHFGYHKHPEIYTYFKWRETDGDIERNNKMVFWLKSC